MVGTIPYQQHRRHLAALVAVMFVAAACSTSSSASPSAAATAEPASPSPAAAESPSTGCAGGVDLPAKYSTPLLTDEHVITSGKPLDTCQYKKDGPYTIAYINWSAANSWTAQVNTEAEDEASRYPDIKEFISINADGDSNKQIAQVEDMVARQVDAIIVDSISPEGIVPAIEQAYDAGIPVFLFASGARTNKYVSSLLADEVQFGRSQGDFLMKELDCKGKIVVLNGLTGNSTNDQRRQGLTDAIKACPDGGSSITILAEADAMWAYDQGKIESERLLAAYPEIDGVWSQGGAMTQGMIDAMQAAGRELVPMTGEDNNGFILQWQSLIPSGFKAMAASEPTWQARLSIQSALLALQGLPVYNFYQLKVPTIYEDQVAEYARPEYTDAYWANSLLPKAVADKIYLKP